MHPTSIAALFTIAKVWKQPKCPPTDEWMKKMWYIYIYVVYTMEYNSAMRNNVIMPFTATWMKLEGNMLSEISQTEKDKLLYDITYMWNLEKVQ